MIELPLVFLGGLLGSAHCVGMCGGFAVSIGLGARGFAANLRDSSFTRPGGSSPIRFSESSPATRVLDRRRGEPCVINVQATLCVLAGVLLSAQGLLALGMVPRRLLAEAAERWIGLPGGNVRRAVPRLASVVQCPAGGVLTGFLPCGLVYGYLALASSSANIWAGLLTMSIFGAGTGPLMILAGAGGSLLSHAPCGAIS